MNQRPNVQRCRADCASDCIELAQEKCEPPDCQAASGGLTDGVGDLPAKAADLLSRNSELHSDRVDLQAEELDGLSRSGLDLLRVDLKTQLVKKIQGHLSVLDGLLAAPGKDEDVVDVDDTSDPSPAEALDHRQKKLCCNTRSRT